VTIGSSDPRRAWWNAVAPVPSGVTQWPFAITADSFSAHVQPLTGMAFVVDQAGVVAVLGHTRTEAAALVHLDKAVIHAAALGPLPPP
jgi:hypothetical protein